ncbi:hypothetical protein CDL15_Pgr005809 [Punica granatum]|uniref:3-ketoacyl-CoA synthase n=1 Tax=Punica granatum TaxID=22663 RepID=A0A218WHZ3_PUNGR|nr:hypothetical protein CDL15_Pgr005809 [Punica granatum]
MAEEMKAWNAVPAGPSLLSQFPNFLLSVWFKYGKLGYHYLTSTATYLLLVPLLGAALVHLATLTLDDQPPKQSSVQPCDGCTLLGPSGFPSHGLLHDPAKESLLMEFSSCYKPEAALKCMREVMLRRAKLTGIFTEENLDFMRKILERSGKEAETFIFGAMDELLSKTRVKAKDIGILVLVQPDAIFIRNVVNHYKLRSNILSYNLGGMGCSAGLISIDLAKQLLLGNPNSFALVENLNLNSYTGQVDALRTASSESAELPSSSRTGAQNIAAPSTSSSTPCGTHKGANDKSYRCFFQQEDEDKKIGVTLSKDLMVMSGEALKTNITTRGPLVLPICKKNLKIKPYIPNFKLALEHFCVHASGRAVLDELEKNLKLIHWHIKLSRMTPYMFGNTSSSSLWYELPYFEAEGRIKRDDRMWQIAFGSGVKCNSAVWKALRTINPIKEKNPWMDKIDGFPVHVPKVASFDVTKS